MDLPLSSIAASAALGASIGLIRQWSDQEKKPKEEGIDFGGLRTHTFWSLLGCLGGAASPETPWVLPAIIFALAAHQIVVRWQSVQAGHGGGTSFAGMLLTLLIGALVSHDFNEAAVLVTALTMVMIGIKKPVHAWTRHFTNEDVRAALQFAAITGVVLPLVPNRDMGPFGGFNPYSTWWMVVLISGVGFAGYIAMRLLGTKAGILVTGIAGGLASSTAATLAFTRSSRNDPALSLHYALAITLACAVLVPRVIVVIALINPQLALASALPLTAMAVPTIVFAVWYYFRGDKDTQVEAPAVGNPLSLKTAIKFALLYAAVAFLVTVATANDWQGSLLPLSFVSGLTDVNAISLSMARGQRGDGLPLQLAVNAVVLAVVANSLLKGIVAIVGGAPRLRLPIALVLGATALAGTAMIFVPILPNDDAAAATTTPAPTTAPAEN